jgi:hypothetical protein
VKAVASHGGVVFFVPWRVPLVVDLAVEETSRVHIVVLGVNTARLHEQAGVATYSVGKKWR